MDEKDLLLAMYDEQVTQARQHEVLRATATNLTYISGAILTSLLFKDGQPVIDRHALAVLLIGIGFFGFLFAMKHYERNRCHVAIARQYRLELEKLLPGGKISALRALGKSTNQKEFPYLSQLRLHWLWSGVSLVFVAVGGAYFVIST